MGPVLGFCLKLGLQSQNSLFSVLILHITYFCIYPHPFSFCTCIQWFVQVLWHQTDCGVECVQAPLTRSRASKERNKVMDSPEQLQAINGSPLERQKKKQSLGQRRSLGARRQSMVIDQICPVPVFLLFASWATHPMSAILILIL
jgi:hypothetical protein